MYVGFLFRCKNCFVFERQKIWLNLQLKFWPVDNLHKIWRIWNDNDLWIQKSRSILRWSPCTGASRLWCTWCVKNETSIGLSWKERNQSNCSGEKKKKRNKYPCKWRKYQQAEEFPFASSCGQLYWTYFRKVYFARRKEYSFNVPPHARRKYRRKTWHFCVLVLQIVRISDRVGSSNTISTQRLRVDTEFPRGSQGVLTTKMGGVNRLFWPFLPQKTVMKMKKKLEIDGCVRPWRPSPLVPQLKK